MGRVPHLEAGFRASPVNRARHLGRLGPLLGASRFGHMCMSRGSVMPDTCVQAIRLPCKHGEDVQAIPAPSEYETDVSTQVGRAPQADLRGLHEEGLK